MITILLIIGFWGLMFGLVAAVFTGIVSAIGVVIAALMGLLVKTGEKR